MNKLSNKELEHVKGGIGFFAVSSIISAVIFVVGVLDGIARPIKCNG